VESIAIASSERKRLIAEMKRETKPSRRLRMHVVLLASDGRSPTEISRAPSHPRKTPKSKSSKSV
jgi:hypothetical protein